MTIAEIDGRTNVPVGTRLGDWVSLPRFIFLAISIRADQPDQGGEGEMRWMLVSPNNRQLGRSAAVYPTYADCRSAVHRLRSEVDAVRTTVMPVEQSGQWVWRAGLDGTTVATSSRSYLRLRECQYNVECFLHAVPLAAVSEGARRQHDRRATTSVYEPATPSAVRSPAVSRLLPGSGLGGALR